MAAAITAQYILTFTDSLLLLPRGRIVIVQPVPEVCQIAIAGYSMHFVCLLLMVVWRATSDEGVEGRQSHMRQRQHVNVNHKVSSLSRLGGELNK